MARKQNRLKRVLRVIVWILAGFTAFSVVSTEVFFLFFGGRTQTQTSELVLSYERDIDASLYPREKMIFRNGDTVLHGMIYGRGGEKGLIAVNHGFGSSADAHLPEILYFADMGYTVVTFDGSGTGESGGRRGGLQQSRYDLEALLLAVDADETLTDLPLYLYGHSMGGYAAAAVLPEFPEVRAAAAVSAFDIPSETMLLKARRYVSYLADIEMPFLRLHCRMVWGAEADASAAEAAERSGTPILVVQGANDTVLDEGARLYTKLEKSGADNAWLLLLTDEDHSGHSDVLFSEESAALRNEITDRDSGKNTEDPDTIPKIKDPVDPAALNAPNTELLDTILRFFEEAGEPDKGGTKE